MISQVIAALLAPVLATVGMLLLLLIFRVVLRKHWLAVGAVVLLLALPNSLGISGSPLVFVFMLAMQLVAYGSLFLVLSRFGLLSVYVCFAFLFLIWPVAPQSFSTWYAATSIVPLMVMAAIVAYGFFTSVAGRSVFGGSVVPQE